MSRKILTAAAAAFAVATPIAVTATVAEQAPAAETTQHESRNKERRICRRTASTGTRLAAPRICMTKAQWDAEETRSRDDMSAMQNRQRVAVPSASGVQRGCAGLTSC